MILSLIVLFVTTIYLLITTFYYRDKYYCDHNLVEILDESTLMYYKQMVDLDIENDLLKKLISSIKLENAELKSSLYIGFPSRNVGGDSK
jgi:ABC-type uncharacterized transport system permease subunit